MIRYIGVNLSFQMFVECPEILKNCQPPKEYQSFVDEFLIDIRATIATMEDVCPIAKDKSLKDCPVFSGNENPDLNYVHLISLSNITMVNQIEEADNKSDNKVERNADSKAYNKADSKLYRKSDSKADMKADSKTDGKSNIKSDSKADIKAESKANSNADSKSDSEADNKVNINEDTKADSKKYKTVDNFMENTERRKYMLPMAIVENNIIKNVGRIFGEN